MSVLALLFWFSLLSLNMAKEARWQQTAKLTDPKRSVGFGDAVAMHQDLMVVGAYEDDPDIANRAGAVFSVYKRLDDGVWNEQARLTASEPVDPSEGYQVGGLSVAIQNVPVVGPVVVGSFSKEDGSNDTEAVYIYGLDNAVSWTQQQKLVASDASPFAYFGYGLALRQNTLVVTAPWKYSDIDAGAVYVYEFQGASSEWTETAKLKASNVGSNARFGCALALHEGGHRFVVGAASDDDVGFKLGSAYVFQFEDGVWTEQAKLTASDKRTARDNIWFGLSVDMNDDRIVVGAPRLHQGRQRGSNSGTAYIFEQDGSGYWTEQAKLVHDPFGNGLALYNDTLFLGAPACEIDQTGSVVVYSFLEGSGSWIEQTKLSPNDDSNTGRNSFGATLAFQDEILVVGAVNDDNRGSVYIFERLATAAFPSVEPGFATLSE